MDDAATDAAAQAFSKQLIRRIASLLMVLAVTMFWAWSSGHAQQTDQTLPLQVLHNHLPRAVSNGRPAVLGSLPPEQNLNFTIVLPLRNQTELTSLLARIYDPSSPDYHHFLSVEQFTEQFGPTVEDYQAVVSFARANGLTVMDAPANRLIVPLSGSVVQVNQAFHVAMTSYRHPTENRAFYSPDREPSLNLGVRVAHISGLTNFSLPHPMLVRPENAQFITNVGGSGPSGSYLASDMRAAYYGGTTLTGAGQAVGLLEFGGYNLTDVGTTFTTVRQTFTIPINNVLLDGATGAPISLGGGAPDDSEQVIDIVQAVGMAPGLSQIRVYIGVGGDDANILNSMATENIAKQISCSWSWSPEDPATDDVFFQEFAAQGQSFFTASGDDGAFDAAISPFFYPQEDAYVTAVGATHLNTNPDGTWSSETAWNAQRQGSGGGISPDGTAIPSWQAGMANSAKGGSATLRNVPDVGMEGDFDNYICYTGGCSGGWGGTSVAAPRWAAFMALVNQQAAATTPSVGVGFINPQIYAIGAGASYLADMHDITVGNNLTRSQPAWFNAVSGYDLVTGWGSPNGQKLIDALAGPQAPGFWLASSLSSISLGQGSSSSATITVNDAGGFSGNVSLAVTSTLPAGVTASWGTNPTSGTSVLTLTATSSAPVGAITLTITGTSGSLSESTFLTVTVHAPSFTLSDSPTSLTINQGGSGTSTITIVPQYGFSGSVSMAVTSPLPSGVTASWSPNPTTGSSVLTLTASSTAPAATVGLTITGTSGNLTATTSLTLTVRAQSFSLYAGGIASLGQGSSAASYINIYGQNGFTGNVSLNITGLPNGVTALFSPNPTNGSSTLTLTASSTAAIGSATLTITGTSGSLSASTTLTVGIYAPTFTVSSFGSVSIGQGTSVTTGVSVNLEYGFNSAVNLAVTGLPNGVTASLSPNPTTGSSQLTLTASSTAAVGQSTVTITGTSGTVTASTTFTLGVYTPTFTLTTGGLSLGQGSSGTTSVNVTPEYGFTGSVSLAVAGLPSGLTASFSPNPTTGSSTITVTASSAVTPALYNATITGTSGNLTASSILNVTVSAPSFSISSGGMISVGQGSSSSIYVNVYQQSGFSGSVNLAVTGLPSGVTASFSPNPAIGNSILTLTASSSTPVGSSTLTITGTSGSLSSTTVVTLTVSAPSFTLTAGGGSIGQGGSSNAFLSVTPQFGFTGSVSLAVAGLPSGVTGSFSPNPTSGSSTLALTASSTVALGQYTVTVTGTSGSLTVSTTFPLTVVASSFTLFTGTAAIAQGTSGSTFVDVQSQSGFSGSVRFSVAGLPSGVTAYFTPNPTTNGNSTITLTANSTVAPGQYNLTVTGVSGSQSASTTLALRVSAPSFSLSDNSSVALGQGSSATTYVTVFAGPGFTGSVNLTASGLPGGVTASFGTNPTTNSSALTLTASSTAAVGQYSVTITGISGTLSATTNLTVSVYAPSFNLSTSSVTVGQGSSASSLVGISPLNGFTGSVHLAVSGLPGGVTAAFGSNPTTGSTSLVLTASSTATLGQYNVTVTGTSGSLTSSAVLTLGVYAPSFTLAGGYGISIGQGSSGTSSVIVAPQYGFMGSVSLAVTGLPSGVTASFSPNTITNGGSVLTLTASSTASVGQYNATVIGTSGSLSASTILNVTVYPQSFTLQDIGIVSVGQGSSTTSTVYLTPQYGFTGSVNLAVTGLPSGVTASFAPNPVSSGGSLLTLTASSTASLGQYMATVTGTSGGLTVGVRLTVGVYVPSFALSGSNSVVIDQGGSNTANVYVTPQYGFTGSVNLTASGLPSGVTATFSPNPVSSASTSVMTLTATNTSASGTYNVTITGTSGNLAATTQVNLTVYAESFTLSDAPSQMTLAQGGSGLSTIYVTPQYGFTGSVNLAATGLPSGVTASFAPNPASGSSTLTLAASSTAKTGPATVTITGTSGSRTAATSLFVTVGAAQATTQTTLTVSSAGTTATSVPSGSMVTLTAAVAVGSTPLTTGQVSFCDASAAYCEDTHLLGTAQLTSAGTATLKFIPGMGSHRYKAMFADTRSSAGSSSDTAALTVTAASATSTAIAASGSVGNYTLTATVTAQGLVSPSGNVAFQDTSSGNAILGTAALGQAKTALNWLTSSSPATGSNPYAIATGDFNGDGVPDLAVANNSGNTVTVLLGNGDGTFTASGVSPPTGNSPWSIAVGDFSGNGRADLAVANYASNTLTILMGNGDGTFTQAANVPTGSSPVYVAVADFNGDGIPDLAVENQNSNTVTILLGNGDGTFTPSASPSTGGYPRSFVIGDFNRDGVADLAVACESNNAVTILLGNGDGTFTASPVGFQLSTYPSSVATGDFNGDGIGDLAVANSVSNTVSIFLGNGDGTFTAAASPTTGVQPQFIVASDFNGDGKVDLAVSNFGSNSVTLLLGNGDGTFTATPAQPVGTQPWGVLAAPFTRNASPGLAVANYGSSTVTVLTSQLTQTATAVANNVSPVGSGAHLVAASYPGDNNYKSSVSGTTSLTALPVVTVVPSASSITLAQPLTVTITVSGGNGNPVPTGSVTLTNGSYSSAPASLTAGVATISIAAGSLPTGTDTLTVTYTPDANSSSLYNASTGSRSVTVTGNTADTLTLSANPASAIYGQPVALSATLSPYSAQGASSNGELISFSNGSTTLGTGTLNNGVATLTVATLPIGSDSLTAAYAGDAVFIASTSNVLAYTVSVAPTISFSVPNHTYGDAPFTLSATSNSPGAISYSVVSGPANISGATVTLTGTGTVVLQTSQAASGNYAAATQNTTFTVAARPQSITFAAPASPVNLGAAPVFLSASASSGLAVTFSVLSGPATVSGNTLTITGAGTAVVAADQAGNANYAAAPEVTHSIIVNKIGPSVGITASPNPVLAQNAVGLVATVSSSLGTPTGSVVFSDGGTALGTANLTGGVASLSVSTLAAGTHSITAVYSGDGNFNSVTSTGVSETVQDFTWTPTSSAQTVQPGGTATYIIPVGLSGGTTLPAVVAFSVTGVPTGFTAAFTPATLAAGSSATNVTLTVQVPVNAMLQWKMRPGPDAPLVAFAVFLIPLAGRIRRSRTWLLRLTVLVAMLAGAAAGGTLIGCGGGSGGSGGGNGSQPRTYNLTVTATSGALSHSTPVTLTVQ